MFAERFDALMNIAELSNSQLGRAVSMNGSHIGRLRSGTRPLPKKHDYLAPMCRYLTGHLTKHYQLDALRKLTGIGEDTLANTEHMARYLEQWLLAREEDSSAAVGRLISGFSRLASRPAAIQAAPFDGAGEEVPRKFASYLYGDAGKRRAVEQFFLAILREERPQTLLLFSDERMSWLYEDPSFALRWQELFTRVIMRGNRVRVIHTVSRDFNELLEAVTKWIPIYMTGMIEPYCYPRLRDGVFQRTLFIAPRTAAVASTSVQQNTEGMLNLFLTDRAALDALEKEFERYFALCRPLMRIYTARDAERFRRDIAGLTGAEGDACLSCALPPLFSLPKALMLKLAEKSGLDALPQLWKRCRAEFRRSIKKQRLALTLLDPELALQKPTLLRMPMTELFAPGDFSYAREDYLEHCENLRRMAKAHEGLSLRFRADLDANMLIYVKQDVGVLMAKTDAPAEACITGEKNMTNAFWDYLARRGGFG